MPTTYNLTVVGAGYVGLATAVGLASRGHSIDLVEIRRDRLETLHSGKLPIHEPAMERAFADPAIRARIHPIDHMPDGPTDAVLVCVGTPVGENGKSDLRQLEGALQAAGSLTASGAPVVIRSTLPAGSNDQVVRWAGGDRSRIFTNPEFLAQGTALEDFLAPSRVVIGTFENPDPAALKVVTDVLGTDICPVLVVSVVEADLIKNGANAYLDPRLGKKYMQPGFGFGGSCLPKDLRSITNVGRDLGLEMHVTSAASEANEAHQRRFARRILSALPSGCRRVAMLGLAFKAGTDDVRSSPALRVAELMIARGVEVVGYDPFAAQNAALALPGLQLAATAADALAGAGVAVIGTEWPEFIELDWRALAPTMAAPIVIDGRRLLDGATMRALGFSYSAVGAPSERAPLVRGTARSDEPAAPAKTT